MNPLLEKELSQVQEEYGLNAIETRSNEKLKTIVPFE